MFTDCNQGVLKH